MEGPDGFLVLLEIGIKISSTGKCSFREQLGDAICLRYVSMIQKLDGQGEVYVQTSEQVLHVVRTQL